MEHPLDGARAKIDRANETVRYLDSEITTLFDNGDYTFIRRAENLEANEWHYNGPEIPPRVSVLVGEVIHNLRSGLSHVVGALVLHHTGQPPGQSHEFPIVWDAHKYPAIAKAQIQDVPTTPAARIQALQPYHRGSAFNEHPLYILHDLYNIDKHRLLIRASPMLIIPERDFLLRPPDLGTPDRIVLRRHADTEMQMKLGVTIDIVLDQFGGREAQPVVPALQQLSDFTGDVVESFVGEFT